MKLITKIMLAALMLFAISCKKESDSIQSSGIADENATQAISTDADELVGANAVKIGTQVWMKKNLNVSHYRNGDRIPQVKSPAKWAALTTVAWCRYNNDSANGAIYGKLYNWYAVNDPRGLAPAGWHIPSWEETKILFSWLGNNSGGKMKSTGTIEAGTGLWYKPNSGATNSSGFTGLPGGYRSSNGLIFYNLGIEGYWWTSTVETPNWSVWFRYLKYDDRYFGEYYTGLKYGNSVRCIKD